MSSKILQKNWKKWSPNEVCLKNFKKKTFLNDSDQFLNKDFFEDVDNIENVSNNKSHKIKELDLIKQQSFDEGFQKGVCKQKKENIVLSNKLTVLFSGLENSFSEFENELYSELIKIILTISSYVIGKKLTFDKLILAKKLKDIINKEGLFLKKPKLLVHPNSKSLIEETFGEILNNYNWKIIYDRNIDVNGCKIRSENSNIDATINSRLHELFRLISSEAY